MQAPFLECVNLEKRFGDVIALQGFTVRLARGEVLALLGPSGCGKTTALNLLQGLLRPNSGRIVCDGIVLDDPDAGSFVPMRERRFATVFQDFSLWPHMSVEENVAYGLRIAGVPRAERRRRADEAMAMVGLTSMSGRRPGELSGGQQQRVAIARAVVVRPRVLLLDEPLSALDARLRDELRADLAVLLRETGCTAVYVTHDQAEALTLADQIAVMRAGRIEQLGTPTELYTTPRTAFVASFVGGANVLHEADAATLGIVHTPHAQSSASSGLTRAWMIRKERVSIVRATAHGQAPLPGPHANLSGCVRLEGTCLRAMYLGDRFEIVMQTAGGGTICGIAPELCKPGERISATFGREDVREVLA